MRTAVHEIHLHVAETLHFFVPSMSKLKHLNVWVTCTNTVIGVLVRNNVSRAL